MGNVRSSYATRLVGTDLDDLWELEGEAEEEEEGSERSPSPRVVKPPISTGGELATTESAVEANSPGSSPRGPAATPQPLPKDELSSQHMLKSVEMGAEAASGELPLADSICGTFSCHGLDDAKDKANQDAACVAYPLEAEPDAVLLMVLDGHGDHGHFVSQELLERLYARLTACEWGETHADEALTAQMTAAFEGVHDSMTDFMAEPGTKGKAAGESGAAGVVVILRRGRLLIAHAGDCRAVLGTLGVPSGAEGTDQAKELIAVDLTHDHKLEDPKEATRIEACGGYIRPAQEEPYFAPSRVFADAKKFSKGPGLSMARSLCDMDADAVGVIPTPEVSFRSVQPVDDQFIVLASDGVWEFLSSDEVVEMVGGFYARGEPAVNATRYLIAVAARRWLQEEEGYYRDDITAIVLYLNEDMPAGLL